MLTWFWMRSLTRSMGAAAVFETAAETPPTVDKPLARAIHRPRCRQHPRIVTAEQLCLGPRADAMAVSTYSRSRPRSPVRVLAAESGICVAIISLAWPAPPPIARGHQSISWCHCAAGGNTARRHVDGMMELMSLDGWKRANMARCRS